MNTNTDPVRALAELAERAVPFLRDEAAKYDDDGSNEPLELAREIETALASLPSDESALSSANSAFDGGREAALASAPPSAPVGVDGRLSEVVRFLMGEAPLEGRWFDDPGDPHGGGAYWWRKHLTEALAQQPAAPSGEALRVWLRMKPDGTPDWAEDCIGSDDKFLDPEMASDGYYLQPLYAAPQQPAGVDEAARVLAELHPFLAGLKLAAPSEEKRAFIQERIDAVRRASAALAAQQQGGRADG